MAIAETVAALVALEDRAPSALFEKFSGTDIHIWPYLRWPMSQSVAEVEHGTVPVTVSSSAAQQLRKLASRLVPNRFASRHTPRNSDLLFVVAGRTQADTAAGRKNWLTDYFAEDYSGRAAVVQYRQLTSLMPTAELPVFSDTYSFHDAEFREDINARLHPLSDSCIEATRAVIDSLYSELEFAVSPAGVTVATRKVLRHQARIEGMRKRYDTLLARASPKIVIMDGASYGGSRAIQVRAAKERGIPVAELQHGWIGAAHGAYNFGQAMWRDEMRQYLPDTLLTFGDYWAEDISSPFDTVSIGKPHLEAMVALAPPLQARPLRVLVTSNPHDRQSASQSTMALRALLPKTWKVVFRPHPSERATVAELYPELAKADGVEFDLHLDVYQSLREVRAVLGHSSTVLFEAISFSCATFVFDSPLADLAASHPAFGERIVDNSSLAQAVERILLTSTSEAVMHITADSKLSAQLVALSRPRAVENFREFIDKTLGEH